MTTIACTKHSIGCDLQVSWNGGYKFRTKTKVFGFDKNAIIPEPFYAGYAGKVESAHKIMEWLRDPDNVKRPKGEADILVLTQSGKIITFRDTNPDAWIEVNEPFFSIGSGAPFAQATLLAGLSVKEAIQAASKLDPNTGMGVKVFDL